MRSAGCRRSTGELAAVYHDTGSVWDDWVTPVACQSTGCTCGITIHNLLGDMGYCSCVIRVVGHTKYIREFGNVELYSNPSVVIDTAADGTEVSGSLWEVTVVVMAGILISQTTTVMNCMELLYRVLVPNVLNGGSPCQVWLAPLVEQETLNLRVVGTHIGCRNFCLPCWSFPLLHWFQCCSCRSEERAWTGQAAPAESAQAGGGGSQDCTLTHQVGTDTLIHTAPGYDECSVYGGDTANQSGLTHKHWRNLSP